MNGAAPLRNVRTARTSRRPDLVIFDLDGCLIITDKLRSYDRAKRDVMPGIEHRSHKGMNNRAENSHQPTRRREKIMKGFKSSHQLQRFVSIHDPIANLFHLSRNHLSSADYRDLRSVAMETWREIARVAEA